MILCAKEDGSHLDDCYEAKVYAVVAIVVLIMIYITVLIIIIIVMKMVMMKMVMILYDDTWGVDIQIWLFR